MSPLAAAQTCCSAQTPSSVCRSLYGLLLPIHSSCTNCFLFRPSPSRSRTERSRFFEVHFRLPATCNVLQCPMMSLLWLHSSDSRRTSKVSKRFPKRLARRLSVTVTPTCLLRQTCRVCTSAWDRRQLQFKASGPASCARACVSPGRSGSFRGRTPQRAGLMLITRPKRRKLPGTVRGKAPASRLMPDELGA